MGEKSHVGMLVEHCRICGNEDDKQGAILLDKRLRASLDRETHTIGEKLCEECQKMADDDRVALIVVQNKVDGRAMLRPSEADRTGGLLWLRRDAAREMFNREEIPEIMFIDVEVEKMLREMMEATEN